MKMTRRSYSTARAALILGCSLLLPLEALAEKGALTFEAAPSVRVTALWPPLTTAGEEDPSFTTMPGAGLSVRYALTHDLGLGLRLAGEPWRVLVHEDVSLQGGGGQEPLRGRLVHAYSAYSLELVLRAYLVGYDYRLFLESAAGWSRRMYRDLDHLQVLPDDRTISYGLRIRPFSTSDLLLGAALGLEHVWDRFAVGLRAQCVALLLNDAAFQGRAVLYAAYDLYL